MINKEISIELNKIETKIEKLQDRLIKETGKDYYTSREYHENLIHKLQVVLDLLRLK